MKLDLRKFANQGVVENQHLILTERLPDYVQGPVQMNFSFSLENRGDYILLHLAENAKLELICQRCADVWSYHYQKQHELAVCRSEAMAEKYQSLYDPIVVEDGTLDFLAILTDNLHLFLPVHHEKIDACKQED